MLSRATSTALWAMRPPSDGPAPSVVRAYAAAGPRRNCAGQVTDGWLYGAGWASRGRGRGQIYRYHGATIPSVHCPVTGVSAFGNAIVSRLPLSNLTTRVLPFWKERRLIMGVDVGGFSFPVRAYCVHLSPGCLENGVDQVNPAARFTDPDDAHIVRFGD